MLPKKHPACLRRRDPHAPISQKLFCYFGGAEPGVSKSAHLLKCSTNFLHMNSSVVELTFYNPRFCISRFDKFPCDPPRYILGPHSLSSLHAIFSDSFQSSFVLWRYFLCLHVVLFFRLTLLFIHARRIKIRNTR